ncbi:MAG TPA: hypothetical protein VHL52_08350 [Acidimicrobiia bacterium]|nr:hypothetical protein [Acidimicrobiia bacterium]
MNIPRQASGRARGRAVRRLETAVSRQPDPNMLDVFAGAFLGALVGTVAVITSDVDAPVLAIVACAFLVGLAGWALDSRRRRGPGG